MTLYEEKIKSEIENLYYIKNTSLFNDLPIWMYVLQDFLTLAGFLGITVSMVAVITVIIKPILLLIAIRIFVISVLFIFLSSLMEYFYKYKRYYKFFNDRVIYKNDKIKEMFEKYPYEKFRIYIKDNESSFIIYDKESIGDNLYDYTLKIGKETNILNILHNIVMEKFFSENVIEEKVKDAIKRAKEEEESKNKEIEKFNSIGV